MPIVKHNGKIVNGLGLIVVTPSPLIPLIFKVNAQVPNLTMALPLLASNQIDTVTTTTTQTGSKKNGYNTNTNYNTVTTTVYGDPTAYSYDFRIDWGDGSGLSAPITDVDSLLGSHTYASPGIKTIKIYGKFESFDLLTRMLDDTKAGYLSIKNTLTEIVSWGDVGLKRIRFENASNLTAIPPASSPYKLFDITDWTKTFQKTKLASIPSDLFDNSPDIDSFDYCFENCDELSGSTPALWDMPEYASATHIAAYAYASGLSNYDDIPSSWIDYL